MSCIVYFQSLRMLPSFFVRSSYPLRYICFSAHCVASIAYVIAYSLINIVYTWFYKTLQKYKELNDIISMMIDD